ncbi:MAG: tetratricopeptide repeat protein, partial [Chloroflexota bacterium]
EEDIKHVKYQYELMNAIYLDHCGDLDQASVHLQNALDVAELINDKDAIAKTKHELAINFGRRGDMVHAEYYSNQAMDWYKKKGDRLKLEGTRANLAGMYLQSGEFQKVIDLGNNSLQFFENIKNENWISSLCHNLSEAHFELGNIEEAETLAHRVLQIEDSFNRPYAMYTLGMIYESRDENNQAMKSFEHGIDVATQMNDLFIEAYLNRALGSLLAKLDHAEKAAEYLLLSKDRFESMSLFEEAKVTQNLLNEFNLVKA